MISYRKDINKTKKQVKGEVKSEGIEKQNRKATGRERERQVERNFGFVEILRCYR